MCLIFVHNLALRNGPGLALLGYLRYVITTYGILRHFFTSHCLSFLISKMGIIIVHTT